MLGLVHPGSRTTHHGPEARAPVSMAGLGRRRVGRRGSVGAVPEDGAWAEFCSDDGARSLSDLGVVEQTYYRWRKEYGGLKVELGSVADCTVELT
jgi:hypothetical protein